MEGAQHGQRFVAAAELPNPAKFEEADRALIRPLTLGRRAWLFAGSDRGGWHAAAIYTLIGTARLNDIDPQAWLADVLDRIAKTPQIQLDQLLPWHWKVEQQHALSA